MLNSVSRSLSEGGRSPSHVGALRRRPLSVPAITRTLESSGTEAREERIQHGETEEQRTNGSAPIGLAGGARGGGVGGARGGGGGPREGGDPSRTARLTGSRLVRHGPCSSACSAGRSAKRA